MTETSDRRPRGRWSGPLPWAILTAVGVLAIVGGRAMLSQAPATPPLAITIGAKDFTEQDILADILAEQIIRRAGAEARVIRGLDTRRAFEALLTSEIDLYVEYTGTIWAVEMANTDVSQEGARLLEDVRAWLADRHGVRVVAALGFSDAYAIAMADERAEALGIRTISHLAAKTPRLKFGSTPDLFGRPEWTAVRLAYGFAFYAEDAVPARDLYRGARDGRFDVIGAYSTDGRLRLYDLRTLEDDRRVFPPYDAIVLARPGLEGEAPDVFGAVERLDGAIDARQMQWLNGLVDLDGRPTREVAALFLDQRAERMRKIYGPK